MKFDIHELVGFTEEQKAKFMMAINYGTTALNSPEFKDAVVNFSWTENYRRWFKKYSIPHYNFNENEGKNNLEIYDMFMSGADLQNPAKDGDMDLFLNLYFSNNGVIGYTYPTRPEIYINKKFFLYRLDSKEGNAAIIANCVHEYMHKVGFGHSYYNNSSRPFTVPYAMGDIAEKITLLYARR